MYHNSPARNVKFTKDHTLCYDDVVLIAQPGVIDSRKDIPIEGHRIVVSAMTSIVGPDFLKAVAELPVDLQPTVHIPRDIYSFDNLKLAKELNLRHIFVGVGLNTPELVDLAHELGYNTLLLDVANGYLSSVKVKVKKLSKMGFKVVVGSVHTSKGANDLLSAGASIIRSGIGPGSVCITKDSTGYTRGQITEILALTTYQIPYKNCPKPYEVLADGGLRAPSDAVKAFFAGADYIMAGRMFVDAAESRLRVDGSNIYYGMASALGKKAMGNEVKNVEGKWDTLPTDNVKPLQEILEIIWDGIRSAVSYSGKKTLSEAIGNGLFEIKHSRK